MTAVLIRLDNLHSGGGVQVAHSLLSELADLVIDPDVRRRYPWLNGDLLVTASPEVVANCAPTVVERLLALPSADSAAAAFPPQLTFTLFGPTYDRRRSKTIVAGFADVTSLYPEEAGPCSIRHRPKAWLRRRLSKRFYRGCDVIIVEAPHIAEDLVSRWGIDARRIEVVPNAPNGIFRGLEVAPLVPAEPHRFCYVTRAYPHKNLPFLALVGAELRNQYRVEVTFVVTLTDDEWASLGPDAQHWFTNLGPALVGDLPSIYASCEGCVFPSLLEAFSATPLEALATGRPLVASDRRFCRDPLGDAAAFVDPHDTTGWAEAIAEIVRNAPGVGRRVEHGLALVAQWPTGRDRAMRYLAILDDALHAADHRGTGRKLGGPQT